MRKSTLMTQCPGGLPLGRVKFGEGLATQVLVQGGYLSRICSRMAPSAATTVGIYTLSGEPHMNGRSFRARSTSSVRCGIQTSLDAGLPVEPLNERARDVVPYDHDPEHAVLAQERRGAANLWAPQCGGP